MKQIEDLKRLLEVSETLLSRCYAACKGFTEGTRCQAFVQTYPEAAFRLQRKFPEHPMKVNVEKIDRLASEVLWREATIMKEESEEIFNLIEDTALFQERTVQYLLHLDQSVLRHVDRASPLSMDYTPELLTKYMTLFCNAVRIQILVNSMPKALIIQLYTLVYNLDQLKKEEPIVDPDSRSKIVAYVEAYQNPFAKMQIDFECISSRIAQVLESTVYPAILSFTMTQPLQESQILDIQATDSQLEGLPEYIEAKRSQWRSLCLLPKFREWAIFGFLVCPGEVASLSGLPVMKTILEETMRIVIYRDLYEWIHPLFQMHVRPSLLQSRHIGQNDMKAFLRVSKHLISTSHETATQNCMLERKRRRIYVAESMTEMCNYFEENPEYLTHFRDMAISAMHLAQQEILWYFLHVNEEPPVNAIKAMLNTPKPLKENSCCPTISLLLGSLLKLNSLCLKYRSAIHAQALSEISMANERLIRPCISKLKTQEKDAPNAELLRLISVLSDISNRIEDCPATENEHPDIFLAKLRDDWEEFALGLVSNVHMFTVENLESMTGSLGFLQEIARIMQQSHYVQDIQAFLNRSCNLKRLSNFPIKFTNALREAINGGVTHTENICGWLFALSQIALRQGYEDKISGEEMVLDIEDLAHQWMNGVTGRMINLVLKLAEGSAKEVKKRLDMGEIVQAHENSMQDKNTLFAIVQASIPSDAGPSGISNKEEDFEKIARESLYEQDLQAALSLAKGLNYSEIVRITGTLAICPLSLLQEAVRKLVTRALEDTTFTGKVLQQPTVIAASFRLIVTIIRQIGQSSGANLMLAVREASLYYLTVSNDSSKPSLIGRISSWIIGNLVADPIDKTIVMAPARNCFLSTGKGIKAELYTSPSALSAMLEVFGGNLISSLVQTAEGPLRQALSVLDALLMTHSAMLTSLNDLCMGDGRELWDACRKGALSIGDITALLEAMQIIARVLFFRQLLGEAVSRVFLATAPSLTFNWELAQKSDPSAKSHYDLPTPSDRGSKRADNLLMQLLKERSNAQKLKLWENWPILAALGMQSSAWNSASFAPTRGSMSGRLDGLQICVHSLIQAHTQACMESSYECESAEISLSKFQQCAHQALSNHRSAIGIRSMAIKQCMSDNDASYKNQSCLSEALSRSTHQIACLAGLHVSKRAQS